MKLWILAEALKNFVSQAFAVPKDEESILTICEDGDDSFTMQYQVTGEPDSREERRDLAVGRDCVERQGAVLAAATRHHHPFPHRLSLASAAASGSSS